MVGDRERSSTQTSSLFTAKFWTVLREEADAVSWNLRDARRHGIVGEAKPSIDLAIASAERLVTLVNARVAAQNKTIETRRFDERRRLALTAVTCLTTRL